MPFNYQTKRDFISEVISSDLLDEAINFISKNLYPADVFPHDDLAEWARSNGFAGKED